jgi:hypothetical protein
MLRVRWSFAYGSTPNTRMMIAGSTLIRSKLSTFLCARPQVGHFPFVSKGRRVGPKLAQGKYTILIHITSPKGATAKVTVALQGSKATLVST